MKVIDSSAVAKYLNGEKNWEAAAEVLDEGCVSLELAVEESANSLWKRVHRRELSGDQAKRLLSEFTGALPFVVENPRGLYVPALEVASNLDVAFYDALFLALAKEKELPLVTSDSAQAEGAKRLGLGVELIE